MFLWRVTNVCVCVYARARVCVCMQGKYLRQRDFHNFSAIFPTLTYILFNIQLRNYYDRRPNDIPLFWNYRIFISDAMEMWFV